MTVTEARRTGSRQGLITAGLGLLIAQMIMMGMFSIDQGLTDSFLWFVDIDYKLNVVIGAIILLACGHFYGQLAGKLIVINNRNYILTGIVTGIVSLWTTVFLASWTGFFREGIQNIGTPDDPFYDYIIKPIYWVNIFGLIPATLLGIYFGARIKKRSSIPKNA